MCRPAGLYSNSYADLGSLLLMPAASHSFKFDAQLEPLVSSIELRFEHVPYSEHRFHFLAVHA